jgi:hypothetical protein
MSCLRYKVLSPIRLLLPASGMLFALPFIFEKDLLVYTTLPLFYFLGLYFCLLNFPSIAESLHRRPLYLEDLEIVRLGTSTPDLTFQHIYNIIMNFLLAALFAGLAEYVIFQDIRKKPIIEALGVIGGNLGIYYNVQTTMGKVMIWMCHKYKLKRLNNIKTESIDVEIGLQV